MRVIVPLQGLVHGGRVGLILGSILPCTLFYLLQLYLKRRRPPPPPPDSSDDDHLPRSSSRIHLSTQYCILDPIRVSSRAASIAKPPFVSPYYVGLDKVSIDPYHTVSNPRGVIQLGLSENRLSLELIEKWISENMENAMKNGDEFNINGIATYQPLDGLLDLKMAMADFMSKVMGVVSFDKSQLVLVSGATPAVEILSFCLADHGNAFLIPTPYYPGFDRDMKWRTGVDLIPVHCRSSDNFGLNLTAFHQAFNQARKRGIKVRGILISNPSNPVGNCMTRETLQNLLNFAREKNIHIISDEIFAGSTYGHEEFISMAEIIQQSGDNSDKNRVHIIYGLSKDLSLPGFRVGVICTWNESVLISARKLSRFSSISAPTQCLVISLLSDTDFIKNYIETNKDRIRKMYVLFVEGLKHLGIDCVRGSAGLYCWADMSQLMRTYDEKGEVELWNKMLNVAKINVTPGSACHCIEPGWFRCCFTTLTQEDIPVVMERIRNVVEMCKV